MEKNGMGKGKEFDLDDTVKYEGEYVNGKIVIA